MKESVIYMESIIINVIEKFGYIATMFLIALENIFPPLPSEVILLFSGFITTTTSLNIVIMSLFSTLGSLLGALILYYFGTIFNKEKMKQLIHTRGGKILRLEDNDIDKANEWFDKKGYKAVIICRFIPILRSLISIPAGMNKMNILKFSIYTFLASFIWNGILLYLGLVMGDNWGYIEEIFSKYSLIVLIVMILILMCLFCFYFYKRKYKK